jgi:hypothetical protein
LRRSWSSRSLSKSSICIRNASHNWSTQRRRRFTCADSAEPAAAADSNVRRCDPSSVAWAPLGLGGALAGRDVRRAPCGGDAKAPPEWFRSGSAIGHRVGQANHLNAPWTGSHHLDGEDHKRPHAHHVVGLE